MVRVEFPILTAMVVIGIYPCDKMAQNYIQTLKSSHIPGFDTVLQLARCN